jgi:tRNA(Ile2) C34 agmatinyltransferase TiaS
MTDTETRHERYRRGVCITCGEREHSAGRPRCDSCHVAYAGGDVTIKEATA